MTKQIIILKGKAIYITVTSKQVPAAVCETTFETWADTCQDMIKFART